MTSDKTLWYDSHARGDGSFSVRCPGVCAALSRTEKVLKKKGRINLQSVFARSYSTYEGEMPRLYRSTDEIGRDIKKIKEKITEVYSMLNIRSVLTAAIAAYAESEPEMWIPELRNIVDEADDALGALCTLRDGLDVLKAELEDARWALGE